jgi:hypothetical protein
LPVTLTWDNGTIGPNATYSWTEPGSYSIVVTAVNDCEPVSASYDVEVCQPVEGAEISGPTSLLVGEGAFYHAVYTPTDANQPVTLTWDNGVVGPTAAYGWVEPGMHTISVTATNECGQVGANFTVEVCQPVETVVLHGPATLIVSQTGVYSATFTPLNATLPVSLVWGDGSTGATATYSWTMTGTYTVAVTATNPCGEVGAEWSVEVVSSPQPPEYVIFLPIIVRED